MDIEYNLMFTPEIHIASAEKYCAVLKTNQPGPTPTMTSDDFGSFVDKTKT